MLQIVKKKKRKEKRKPTFLISELFGLFLVLEKQAPYCLSHTSSPLHSSWILDVISPFSSFSWIPHLIKLCPFSIDLQ
jgi:hypothetical protein